MKRPGNKPFAKRLFGQCKHLAWVGGYLLHYEKNWDENLRCSRKKRHIKGKKP